MIDAFGSDHTTDDHAAITAFSAAVRAFASHAPGSVAALDAALEAEPLMTAAHALSGLADILLADERRFPLAQGSLSRSKTALARDGGGAAFERALVAALEHAGAGRLIATRWINGDTLIADAITWGNFTWFNALGLMAPLGGYQAGVQEASAEAHYHPEWVAAPRSARSTLPLPAMPPPIGSPGWPASGNGSRLRRRRSRCCRSRYRSTGASMPRARSSWDDPADVALWA